MQLDQIAGRMGDPVLDKQLAPKAVSSNVRMRTRILVCMRDVAPHTAFAFAT